MLRPVLKKRKAPAAQPETTGIVTKRRLETLLWTGQHEETLDPLSSAATEVDQDNGQKMCHLADNAMETSQPVSLAQWASMQASLSLMPKSTFDSDEDSEDTATSSCSCGSTHDAQRLSWPQPATCLALVGPGTAVTDEADSVHCRQTTSLAATAFSFGHRTVVIPDLSGFETWDLVDSLLALSQHK